MQLVGDTLPNVLKLARGKKMPELPKWKSWTVAEASQETGYNPEYIRRLIRNEDVEAVKVGNVWLIKIDSLMDYINAATQLDDGRYGPKK